MSERDELLQKLDGVLQRLELMASDKDVQERLKKIVEREIDLYSFLLALEKEKTSEGLTFGEKTETKLRIGWRDWIQKIFEKLNSLIGKLVSIG